MADYPLGMLVKHINIQIEKSMNQRLKQIDLTFSQMHVLMYLLARRGQPTTMRDLENFLHQTHVTVTGLVQRLEQKGFVTVAVDPADRRRRLLTPTPAARQVQQELMEHRASLERQLLSGLTGDEAAALGALLQRVAGTFGALPPPPPNCCTAPPPCPPEGPPPGGAPASASISTDPRKGGTDPC